MRSELYTMGVDVGGSYVKSVLLSYSDFPLIIDKHSEKIRKRNPASVAEEILNYLLDRNGFQHKDIAYIASTGEGEMVPRKHGHFYSMTTHARGGHYFSPGVKTVLDIGAFHIKAVSVGENARVLNYKMTGQCASGGGQFVENISRYLGLAVEEVGDISLQATSPETPSGICAVLAETDVINMVSRGVSIPNILKGIHLSVAGRIMRLLTSLKAESPIVLTGGLALNAGLVQAIDETLKGSPRTGQDPLEIKGHPDAIFAGAIGAALWGGYRHLKLAV